jgi:23S rRNA (guanosine2251-2'-O)-methyltransferase
LSEILQLAKSAGVSARSVDKNALQRNVGVDNHQGLALKARPKPELSEQQLLAAMDGWQARDKPPLLLILDRVQDPHNFGACLRTADAAGVDGIVVGKDHACPMTPVVQKVASGAADSVNIYRVTNLARALKSLQDLGIWIIGTSDKAEQALYQTDLSGPLALVMGGEGPGMRALTTKVCDQLMCLPMAGNVVSSLNVSVATGVCLYEAVRQRSARQTT